jgi:hypothetical protein
MPRLVIVAIVLAAAVAHADRTKAEQYFYAGEAAFKNQNFGAAAANFELAYKEAALPEIAFSAAQAYRRQYFIDGKPDHVKRAVELYQAYLDKVKTGGRVADAADGLAEMKRELAALIAKGVKIEGIEDKKLTRMSVSIVVAGSAQASKTELASMPATSSLGATAKIDGKPVEPFAWIDVAPGEHEIEAAAKGYFPITEKRRIADGATEQVEVTLQPKPGRLTVRVDAGVHVAIDSSPVGDAPLAVQELRAGHHVVAITARGREPVVHEIDVARGEEQTVDVGRLRRTFKRKLVPWLWGGAGALAIGSGITAAIAIGDDKHMTSLEHQRETVGLSIAQLADYRTTGRHRDEARAAAFATGASAIAVAGVAAVLFWFDTPTVGERARAIAPMPVAGGATVGVVGRF